MENVLRKAQEEQVPVSLSEVEKTGEDEGFRFGGGRGRLTVDGPVDEGGGERGGDHDGWL